MFAMTIDSNRRLVKATVPNPVRGNGEILVSVRAAAVNRADLMQCDGNYPSPAGWPEWPGLEIAGIVEDAPEGSRWRKGDKVCALLGGGGYAEKVVVPEGMVLPVPENVSMETASAIPEVFSTAYLNFVFEAHIQPGETVFIQAGASGLGIAAIQLAKYFRCKVITTVGGTEKAAFVRKLGADIVVDHRADDLGKVLDLNPPDIALDCVGGASFGENFAKMNPWGRWIMIASLGGAKSEISLDTVFRKRIRLIGSTLRSRTDEKKSEILHALEKDLWPLFSSGKMAPVIHAVFRAEQANEAHAVLRARKNIGKVVLTF